MSGAGHDRAKSKNSGSESKFIGLKLKFRPRILVDPKWRPTRDSKWHCEAGRSPSPPQAPTSDF
jgi:hypothetical protein